MRSIVSAIALLTFVPCGTADPPKPVQPAQTEQYREDIERTLNALRQNRQRLAETHGANHPVMVAIDRAIAFYETFIPLNAALDQKREAVRNLEDRIRRLLERRRAAESAQAPFGSTATA